MFVVFFFYLNYIGGRDLKGTKANPKNLRTAPQSKDQTLTRGWSAHYCVVVVF